MAGSAGARRPRKPRHKRRRLKKLTWLVLLICILHVCIAVVASQPRVPAARPVASAKPTTSVLLYAQLPKPLGLLAGLQVDASTAAFLGVSYAAAPLGPLRLMPPGASLSPEPAVSTRTFRLLPAGVHSNQVREATKFQHECVRLADWLLEPAARQSEDCLNANLFVPLKLSPAEGRQRQPEEQQMSRHNQQQQPDQVLSNYAANQQGFLPVDSSSVESPSSASSSASSSTGWRRLNHAIWDQLALLHWLRRNAPALGADLSNVTLWALDSDASNLLQLLSLSSQAKGLFNSIKLTNLDEAKLERLVKQAREAAAIRRKLATSLAQIVQTLTGQRAKGAQVNEFLEQANLTKLAKLEQALGEPAQLEQARGPTLDDELLFESPARLIALLDAQAPADGRRLQITTRNLLSTHASSELAFAAATNSTQEQVAYVSSSTRASLAASSQPSAGNSTDTGVRGFLAKAYRDAMGKALGVVVGTGLLIFLLNLVIVLVIAVRSSRSRRLAAERRSSQPDQSSPVIPSLAVPTKRSTLKKGDRPTPTQNGSLRTGKQLKFAADLDAKANLELSEFPLAEQEAILLDPAALLERRPVPTGENPPPAQDWQLNSWQDYLVEKPTQVAGQQHNSLGSPTWNSQTTSSSTMIIKRPHGAQRFLAPLPIQQLSPGSSTTLSNTPIQFLQSSAESAQDQNNLLELYGTCSSPKVRRYTCDQVLSQPTFMLIPDQQDQHADATLLLTCQHQHQSA